MEYKLEKLLAPVRSRYDIIFVDCAPTDSVLITMALTASNFVLVPVRPDRFSILGYALVAETMDEFRENCRNPNDVTTLGTIFTQVGTGSEIQSKCMRDIRETAQRDGSNVFQQVLEFSTTFLRAVQDQTPAFDTKFARETLKASIAAIARELNDRILQERSKK